MVFISKMAVKRKPLCRCKAGHSSKASKRTSGIISVLSSDYSDDYSSRNNSRR